MIRCPSCNALMIAGPRGGAAQNFYCTDRERCRRGVNLTIWRGHILHREYLGEVADSTFELYAYRGGNGAKVH